MKLKYFLFSFISLIMQSSPQTIVLPEGFKIGAATASYQIEGAWNVDGKVPNIWDTMTSRHPEKIFDRSNGNEAAKSYEFYKRDVEILKEVGFDYYRFSISWSRVIKKNQEINQKGIDYYNNLITELIDNGIEPMITIYHWDLPQYLQDLGGWANPLIVDYFEHYADVVFKSFGNRVTKWITFNEPWVFCKVGYAYGNHAPGIRRDGTADYLCGHHMLLSHAKAYHLYKNTYMNEQQGEVGICLDTNFYYPLNENVTQATVDKAVNFKFGWFANSIFSQQGGYPPVLREAIDSKSANEVRRFSRLPEFTQEQRQSLIGAADFLAINHYTSRYVIPYADNPGTETWTSDSDIYEAVDDSWDRAKSEWLYSVPRGLHDQLMWIKDKYNNPRVLITENGWSDDGEIDDDGRIKFLKEHIAAVVDAARNGSRVEAFTVWSIVDNFEWNQGYNEKFGIYNVDFESPLKTRTAKKSSFVIHDIIRDKQFNLP